jgi:hypothetical protein
LTDAVATPPIKDPFREAIAEAIEPSVDSVNILLGQKMSVSAPFICGLQALCWGLWFEFNMRHFVFSAALMCALDRYKALPVPGRTAPRPPKKSRMSGTDGRSETFPALMFGRR